MAFIYSLLPLNPSFASAFLSVFFVKKTPKKECECFIESKYLHGCLLPTWLNEGADKLFYIGISGGGGRGQLI